jgi:hypothetical protein
VFNPRYSSALNPIESLFAAWKQGVAARQAEIRTQVSLYDIVGQVGDQLAEQHNYAGVRHVMDSVVPLVAAKEPLPSGV